MAWSMPPSGPWNPGMMPPDMSMASYSQDQWTVMQQQNWQQWAQWQQQYAQWQNQYGDKYAEQMQAFQNMGGMPPLPPPSSAPPPAPPAPPPDQPPPPPHENNKPLYDNLPSQPAPVPPPNNRNTKSNTQGNANWSYGTDTAPQANSSVNSEALKKLAEEERLFDIQFQKWEEEIEKWRKENVNHPDKQAYREYEEKFEACRAQLLERRQQMKLKRAKLTGAPVPPTGEKPTVPSGVPPPMNSMGNNSNMPSQNYSNMSQNSNNQYQQFHAPPTQYNNRSNNKNVDPQDRYESYDEDYSSQNTNMANFSHPDNATFLPTSGSGKGIPGLDLAPDSDHSKKQEVVDITDDAGDSQIGPDYSTISKGINNILGDQTIMNILSMVRQGGEDGNPKAGPNNSGNNFQDGMRQGGNMNRNNPQFGGNNQNNSQYGRNNQSGSQMGNNQVGPQFGGNNHNNSNFGSNNRNVPPLGGFNQNNSQFGGNTPQYERNNPQYERNNPQFGGNNKQFGGNNQQFGGDNQQFGGNNQQFGGNNQQVGRPNQNKQQFGGNNQGNNPNGGNNLYNQQSGPQGQGNRNQNFYAGQNDNRQNMPFSRQRNNNSGPQNMGMNKFPSGEQYGDDMNRQYEDQSYENGPPSLLGRPSGPPSLLGRPNGPKPLMQDMSRGPPERRPLADANVNPVASQPARPKWMEDPLFTPSVIVEYEHKPLRLKAREFIEPVHMFDYNHKSKDEDKKADFEKEVEELFSRKPRRSEPDHANRPSRDYPRERDFERIPPRDEIEERRRPDIRDRFDTRGHDFRERDRAAPRGIEHRDRERDRDRADFRDRFEPRGPDYRDVRDRDARNSDHRDRPERRDDRDKYVRRDEIFSRDRERDRDRGRDSRRDESRQRSRSRDREPLKRALSKDTEVTNNAKKPKESVIPEKARHVVMIDDLLESPGREMRPAKIVIILRGPPGSGKSYLAKLIRDKEAEHGGTVRIMSIDDYFMQEGEVEEKDPATGKMVKKPTLKYEYDAKSETTYFNSLKRAFRRSLLDGYFSFLIFDAVNDELKSYADIWNYARQNGFQVYVCTMETDPQVCFKRNVHGRTLDDIQVICTRFFPTPSHHIQLDPTTLLQSAGITEVHMEDVEDEVVMEEAPQTEVETSFTSKWEKMDDAAQLARLDGTNKPLRPSQLSMEDYLQLDEWKPNTAKPGKKTVRWADLEERREQEKMRAIGFVVGQTDWNRMTDPTRGSSALTQTKYIERVRRF